MMAQNLKRLREMLSVEPELWQHRLLSAKQLGQHARERGVPDLSSEAVEKLWRTGLLRCDLAIADKQLHTHGLRCVGGKDGQYMHCDLRQVPHRSDGLGSVFANLPEMTPPAEPYFHPFRLFVLYHILRVLEFSPTGTQYLIYREGLGNLAKSHIETLDAWSSSEGSARRIDHWNLVAELAICAEPLTYARVFSSSRPLHDRAIVDKYRAEFNRRLISLSLVEAEEARTELCRAAELLDANKLIHVMIRLMASHERQKLRGMLGASIIFLSMAEMIRRSLEELLEMELPEEDEIGFGTWSDGARGLLYGTERILDADHEQQRDFLTSMGLDRGVKARCYVEGPTELGALRSAVGEGAGLQFVNLKGQVVEKRGKGLSFADSLKADRDSCVFSIVLLDGDREDFVRALRASVQRELFFGIFTISTPDFEFANFTARELLSVWLEICGRDGEQLFDTPANLGSLDAVGNGQQLKVFLREQGLPEFEKSEAWGEALMAHALKNELLPEPHTKAGETRPVVQLARQLMTARYAGYRRSIALFRVDAETGLLVRRAQAVEQREEGV